MVILTLSLFAAFRHVSCMTRPYFTNARKMRRSKMHDNSKTKVLI